MLAPRRFSLLALSSALAWIPASGCGRFGVELREEVVIDSAPTTSLDAAVLDAALDAAPQPVDARSPAPEAAAPPVDPNAPCEGSFTECDGDPVTHCESDLRVATAHCGGCGRACLNDHGPTACRAGDCVPTCSLGYADCDGDPRNGCETSVDTASNCGACGNVCAANDGAPLCTAEGCGTTCELTGSWAARVDFAVTWPAATVIVGGSGRVRHWQRFDVIEADGALSGSAVACGTAIPDSATGIVGGERFAVIHPPMLFDTVPPIFSPVAMGLLISGDLPGSTFVLPTFAQARGIVLADPLRSPWPSSAAAVQRDDDADGQPGFTVAFGNGNGVVYPALDLFRVGRADRAYVADRLRYGATGSLVSCLRGTGTATVEAFDTMILGCHVAGAYGCIAPQRDLLAANVQRFTPGSGTLALIKVSDRASCDQVRAALP